MIYFFSHPNAYSLIFDTWFLYLYELYNYSDIFQSMLSRILHFKQLILYNQFYFWIHLFRLSHFLHFSYASHVSLLLYEFSLQVFFVSFISQVLWSMQKFDTRIKWGIWENYKNPIIQRKMVPRCQKINFSPLCRRDLWLYIYRGWIANIFIRINVVINLHIINVIIEKVIRKILIIFEKIISIFL